MSFPCSCCGCCCKRVHAFVENCEGAKDKSSIFYFPYKYDKTGKCEKLINNKCSIYEKRPLICNVDKLIAYSGMDKKKFYNLNIQCCNKMIEQDKLDAKYKLNLII